MEAATLEQSSGDTSPVFVTGRRHRSHAVRLAAATLGLLLACWLAALVAGLVGFSPLPELTLPGTGDARAPAVAPDGGSRRAEHDAGAHASPVAARSEAGGGQVNADASGGAGSLPGASGHGAQVASGQGVGEGTGSVPAQGGVGAAQVPAFPGTAEDPASSGNGRPSFTPRASGEMSASPPRGNSAGAPGQTLSVDPPGRATRPDSG